MVTLKLGSRGNAVEKLQEDLKRLGYYRYRVDGDFGPFTVRAVKEFQTDHLITGRVDEYVRAAIAESASRISLKDPPIPRSRAEIVRIFGAIKYKNTDGGQIKITNDWARKNIVRAVLPVAGREWVHRKLLKKFHEVFEEIEEMGLAEHVRQCGVWCPRHICHNPRKPLSLHSWGIAVDINWATNAYGTEGDMHPDIVDIFEEAGFTWGGRWRKRDCMHFEWAKLR